MKKMLSLFASLSVVMCAVSATASASEIISPFPAVEEFNDGINDGRYLADFDGNGVFDPLDSRILLQYYASTSTLAPDDTIDDVDWNSKNIVFSFSEKFRGAFVQNYDTFERSEGEVAISVDLDNEMLENVRKYGDINGDGCITASDASYLLTVYYSGFEIGDVNADGEVSASDASYVLQYYSSMSTGQYVDDMTQEFIEVLGDVNGDGIIDVCDATAILSAYSDLSVC